MNPLEPLLELIRLVGLPLALIGIGVATYFLIARRQSITTEAQNAANAAQAQAITAQFLAFAADTRRLQTRIDLLEEAKDALEAEHTRIVAELAETKRSAAVQEAAMKAAQGKAALLEGDVKALTEKVAVMESERAVRAAELERERVQVQTTSRSLQAANKQIAQLQERVHALEIENGAFKLLLEKIQVIKVDPDPDPDPDPPPLKVAAKPEVASEDKAA